MPSPQTHFLRTLARLLALGAFTGLLARLAVEPGSSTGEESSSPTETVPPRSLFSTSQPITTPSRGAEASRSTLVLPRYSYEPHTTPAKIMGANSGLRYLALGDSYTVGEGVKSNERFPALLARRLRQRGVRIDDPQIVARTGWTTSELASGIVSANPSDTYDLVTLLVGVNNQYRGLDLSEYRAQFRSLVYQAIEFAGGESGRVIVLSIPDWGATPYARTFDRALINEQIGRFNQANREEAARAGVRYVDITALSREALKNEGLVTEDRLHPSPKQYAAWVDLILPQALAALGQ